MDISFVIVLWIIVAIIQAIDRKKNPPPPIPPNDSNDDINFEIPTLANDPNKAAEVQEIDLAEIYRQKKNIAAADKKPETKMLVEEETKNIEVEISPATAMNAVILSEILDKPKSLRRKKF